MTEQWIPLPMTIKVANCARCGKTHEVEFNRFTQPIDDCTHWGMCPNLNEPILMRIVTNSTPRLREGE